MGVAQSHYAKGDEGLIREFLAKGDASVRSITWEQLARDGWARVALPSPYRPFADGAPTPSGKVEFYSASLERHGLPALPTYVPLPRATSAVISPRDSPSSASCPRTASS